jgi:HSP20 family protein
MALVPRNAMFDIDSIFDNFLMPSRIAGKDGLAAPRVDIRETDEGFEVTAELPGVKKDDIHVSLENGVLTIEATTNDEKTEEKDGKLIRKERYSGKMMRSFSIGEDIDEDGVRANFSDGLLSLLIPKKEQKAREARRIEIN